MEKFVSAAHVFDAIPAAGWLQAVAVGGGIEWFVSPKSLACGDDPICGIDPSHGRALAEPVIRTDNAPEDSSCPIIRFGAVSPGLRAG